ncbi:uncharacterized protein LOC144123999 [Amblyomma americanum]
MESTPRSQRRSCGTGRPTGRSPGAPSALSFAQALQQRVVRAAPPQILSNTAVGTAVITRAEGTKGNGAHTVAPTEGVPTTSTSPTAAPVQARNGAGNTKSQNDELSFQVSGGCCCVPPRTCLNPVDGCGRQCRRSMPADSLPDRVPLPRMRSSP